MNTANGVGALGGNTTGSYNTAIGIAALVTNTTGQNNTATGLQALFNNNSDHNAAYGVNALNNNTSGFANVGIGNYALFGNTTGNNNTALGFQAGQNLTTGGNNIDIGSQVFGVAGESNTIRIGKQGTQTATYIAGIMGRTSLRGSPVFINANGQLGTATSSARFKDEIKPMDKASEAILALKPVSFRYKKDIDPEGTPQFGLVAEDVEKINPDLVVRDSEGKVYTVRYEAVNAMLLNEFLKEHRKVEEQNCKIQQQEATITQLKKDFGATIAQLTGRLDKQASQIQKVCAQLEASKPAPRVVNNP